MTGKFNTNEFETIKENCILLQGERRSKQSELDEATKKRDDMTIKIESFMKARTILQKVAKETQKHLEYQISSLVSTALQAVFDTEAPEFIARIVERRNKTECDLLFKEEGEEYKPEEGSGGGFMDVASFALRIAYWSLKKNRPTLLLDQPFSNVSSDYHGKVSEMLKMVSDDLGIQIIMVSHQPAIDVHADRVFKVTKTKEGSIVE